MTARLQREGTRVEAFSFPRYGEQSAGPIEEYLNGAYGDPTAINPYAASLFYAVDRFAASEKIKAALAANDLVILDRYVDSNIAHQGGKITKPAAQKEFAAWVYELEYRVLGIPQPDLVIILHVPAAIGQQFIAKKQTRAYIKGAGRDGHESNLAHLVSAEATYLWLAQAYPHDHAVIECAPADTMRSIEDVGEELYRIVTARLKT